MLFNNAGINPTDDDSVLDTSLEAWQRVQDVNLRSVFLCCKHGIPHLLEAGGGSVINTASFVAVMGAAVSQISYTASKGAVLSLSRELGRRVRPPRRARQRALPGPGQHAAARRSCSPRTPRRPARRLVHLPMGRFAEASEIAQAALFLASDESSLRDRHDVPGRRRALRRLRHARVAAASRKRLAGAARPSVQRAESEAVASSAEPFQAPISASRRERLGVEADRDRVLVARSRRSTRRVGAVHLGVELDSPGAARRAGSLQADRRCGPAPPRRGGSATRSCATGSA